MLLGVQKVRRSIPGTGRTDHRTTVGMAGSALCPASDSEAEG